MSSMQFVTAVTISGTLVFGMSLALFGRLKWAVARHLQLDDGRVRQLRIALNIALIPLVLLCGVLVDHLGVRSILMAGSFVLSVALVSLSVRPTYPHAFGAILLAALGVAALSTASIVLMPRAFFSPAETSASLNLGYVFITLGVLLTPALADILLDSVGLRRTLGAFALLALVPAFLAVLPNAEDWRIADHPGDAAALFSEPSSWLAALVFLVYAPLEASISLWTLSLLAEHNQDEREAGGLLTGFWAGFAASRLLVAVGRHADVLTEAWDRWIVVIPPLLAAVVIGNLAGASYRGRPRAGLIILGVLLGPVFPTLLAILFRHVAVAEQGLAYGVVFAAGSLGSLLLSPLLTLRSRQPLHTLLRLPIFLALLLTAATLVMELMTP